MESIGHCLREISNILATVTMLGHWDKAEQYYLQALKVTETPPTKNAEETIPVLQSMAIFYAGRQEYIPKAEECAREQPTYAGQIYGPEHYKTAESLGALGCARFFWRKR